MMVRSSRSPVDDSMVVGKILIENLPRRSVTTTDVHNWMKKYGTISEIAIYKDCILVQFDTDLEAAGAVQCENGAQFFGTMVSIRHIEPSILSAIRRSGQPIDRYSLTTRRYPPSSSSRDRDRERESERDRDRFRDRDRGRTRDRDAASPSRGRFSEPNASYDRRRRRDEPSPRRRSRSPISQRGDRRHVHPLNWLSEVAGSEAATQPNGPVSDSSKTPPPYTVAIVAVQHDLVPYAETIEKRVSSELKVPTNDRDPNALRTHIVVLLSADHLSPCLTDLTRDHVPFAIICTSTNWNHGSCTLRILYVPTQQEHRNMPLDDALTLLQKEYDTYLSLGKSSATAAADTTSPATTEIKKAAPEPISRRSPSKSPEPIRDDHTFLAPTRNMITLLRMLADSRILSIGELDEIAAFIQERKRRLEGRRLDSSSAADARNENPADLKSRILNMLYPQSQTNANPAISAAAPGAAAGYGQPKASMPALLGNPSANPQQSAGLATNPVVQQAIDNLMMFPTATGAATARFGQHNSMQQKIPPLMQQPTVQSANIDLTSRFTKPTSVAPVPHPSSYGSEPNFRPRPSQGNSVERYSTYKQDISDAALKSSQTGVNAMGVGQRPGFRLTPNTTDPTSARKPAEEAPGGQTWRGGSGKKRNRRGGGGGRGGSTSAVAQHEYGGSGYPRQSTTDFPAPTEPYYQSDSYGSAYGAGAGAGAGAGDGYTGSSGRASSVSGKPDYGYSSSAGAGASATGGPYYVSNPATYAYPPYY